MGVTYVKTYLGCKIYRYTPPDVAYEQYGSPCLTSNYVKLGAVKKRICLSQGGTWTWNDAKTDGTCSFKEPEPAKGSIPTYDYPPKTTPGTTVTVSATAKNTGETQGTFQLRLRDRDENIDIDTSTWFTLAAASSTTKTLTGTMPHRDWNLRLAIERETT